MGHVKMGKNVTKTLNLPPYGDSYYSYVDVSVNQGLHLQYI